MSITIPMPVIDKNGKHTTVHKNIEKSFAQSIERISSITRSSQPDTQIIGYTTDLGENIPAPLPYDPNAAELYEPIKFYHDNDDHPLPIAPEGYSGARCPECLCYLTRDELRAGQDSSKIICPNCEASNDDGDYGDYNVSLAYDSIPLLNADNVRQETWFHASVNTNWFETVSTSESDPIVHFGSLDAAIARAKSVSQGSSNYSFTIYEMRIKPEAKITKTVVVDNDNLAPNYVTDITDYEGGISGPTYASAFSATDIGRYINGFEDHGSISLASVPSNFELIGSKKFQMKDIEQAREAFAKVAV